MSLDTKRRRSKRRDALPHWKATAMFIAVDEALAGIRSRRRPNQGQHRPGKSRNCMPGKVARVSGDRRQRSSTGRRFAGKLWIDEVRAGVLPETKKDADRTSTS